MAKKSSTSAGGHTISAAVRDYLLEIEPDLQHLQAVVTLLRVLGEAGDSIEPVALTGLAHLSGEALERVTSGWQAALNAVRFHSINPE
jgi:hypothetical protein